MAKEKILLKNELFNESTVGVMADCIAKVYCGFDKTGFLEEALQGFVSRELKERITLLENLIVKYVPESYVDTLKILDRSLLQLPEVYDSFVFAAYQEFIMTRGCCDDYVAISLDYMGEFTKIFSAEFAIRDFINNYPEETFASLKKWSKSDNVHQRRLASEGTRPKLPWSKKIDMVYDQPLILLDNLFYDEERYVTRSVANHLNDISKIEADLVVEVLDKWQKSGKQEPKEMAYIVNHALRTLVKKGHAGALLFLGYSDQPQIELMNLIIEKPSISVGESLEFKFEIHGNDKENLMIDYIINYPMANNKRSDKVFKIKKVQIKANEVLVIHKKHPFRLMTTKKLYSGMYELTIQINGVKFGKASFKLMIE